MNVLSLLFLSNIFMTIAWYWHLKHTNVPIWKVVLISWLIALVEYCLTVPANRLGVLGGWNGFQLKIVQEVVTLVVFCAFAILYLNEPLQWKYLGSFVCLLGAVYFAFR